MSRIVIFAASKEEEAVLVADYAIEKLGGG